MHNLIDGNLTTFWSGDNTHIYLPNPNSQYITFQLDTSNLYTISNVKIAFHTRDNETIRYNFDILVSQDGRTGWVTVLSNKSSNPDNDALQTFSFPPTKGKFVRIVGHGNNSSSPKNNAWSEVEIFGTPAPVNTAVKFSIMPGQVCANNFIAPYYPSNVIDGNLTTHWTSKMSTSTDYKNITINLGAIHLLDFVKLSFFTGGDANRVSRFGVLVSTDSIQWTKVINNTYSAPLKYGVILESFDFPDVAAKYVRVECYGHTGTYIPSVMSY